MLEKKDSQHKIEKNRLNSDIENLAGSANFITLNAALIEKSASNDNEAILACLLKLGKRFLIPLPIIAP